MRCASRWRDRDGLSTPRNAYAPCEVASAFAAALAAAPTDLILRSERSERLEGWRHALSRGPSFETAAARPPQDEVRRGCRSCATSAVLDNRRRQDTHGSRSHGHARSAAAGRALQGHARGDRAAVV